MMIEDKKNNTDHEEQPLLTNNDVVIPTLSHAESSRAAVADQNIKQELYSSEPNVIVSTKSEVSCTGQFVEHESTSSDSVIDSKTATASTSEKNKGPSSEAELACSTQDTNDSEDASTESTVTNDCDSTHLSASVVTATLRLPNAVVGRQYEVNIQLKQIMLHDSLIDETYKNHFARLGLNASHDGVELKITGIPNVEAVGEQAITLNHSRNQINWYQRTFLLFTNPDPRSLWKDVEPAPYLTYRKEHTYAVRVETNDYFVIGASRRGRSHAQAGKFREDHCKVEARDDGWILIAVSDGAGSATLSRRGSELACQTALNHISDNLDSTLGIKLSSILQAKGSIQAGSTEDNEIKKLFLYPILAGAAFSAYKRLKEESAVLSIDLKDLSCTLLLSIVKKFNGLTFIASFSIGDGAIGILSDKDCWSRLLNIPDGGEFAGQTRFLTMRDVVADPEEMLRRISYCQREDFTSLYLMTDGVSDPMFTSEANLNNSTKWYELDIELKKSVCIARSNLSAPAELLEWLNFWIQGEHDDRTIVILSK